MIRTEDNDLNDWGVSQKSGMKFRSKCLIFIFVLLYVGRVTAQSLDDEDFDTYDKSSGGGPDDEDNIEGSGAFSSSPTVTSRTISSPTITTRTSRTTPTTHTIPTTYYKTYSSSPTASKVTEQKHERTTYTKEIRHQFDMKSTQSTLIPLVISVPSPSFSSTLLYIVIGLVVSLLLSVIIGAIFIFRRLGESTVSCINIR
ncbi:hypothetical protein AB6A40_009050 [Gnathostoma spinigerum]|uniref:Uncharacterized protein n=1 Tax=Gnathostoma spinigerum TaxID=75299 RepID=A0ABD6ER65_9BILA